MLGRLATAYADITEVFLVKGDATGFNSACIVFDFVLAFAITAPHSTDEA